MAIDDMNFDNVQRYYNQAKDSFNKVKKDINELSKEIESAKGVQLYYIEKEQPTQLTKEQVGAIFLQVLNKS